MFFTILLFDPNDHFSRAIAFGSMVNFSDFENLVILFFFYEAVFHTEQLSCGSRVVFGIFLTILIFKRPLFEILSFFKYWMFFKPFFAQNKSNVVLRSFLIYF